jgi:Putative transposase/Transposase zinc-binding domain
MRCTLQDVFAEHFDAFAAQRPLHLRERRAAWCIRHCFTASMGSHLLVCPQGHFQLIQYHACRHRSCPRCAEAPRRAWIDAELQRLLPCPHFHAVFTLPHELLSLWTFNRRAMADLLMNCVRESLLHMLASPRHGGIVPGLLMTLHTWGRDLSYHPHVHCLVSAGGLDFEARFKPLPQRWLLPLPPLRKLFAGKLLAGLKALLAQADFVLPPQQPRSFWLDRISGLYNKHWNIEIQPPYGHAQGVALYLAHYLKGGPIPAERPLFIDRRGNVRMPYFEHRSQRRKTLCLPAAQFIERVLWHVPPGGQHLVRRAGLYCAALRDQHREMLDQLRPLPLPAPPPRALAAHDFTYTDAAPRCPRCNAVLLPATAALPAPQPDQISIAQRSLWPSTAVHLGPTQRSSGHLMGKPARAPPPDDFRLRPAGLAHQMPLN